jgi:hypothetical protein
VFVLLAYRVIKGISCLFQLRNLTTYEEMRKMNDQHNQKKNVTPEPTNNINQQPEQQSNQQVSQNQEQQQQVQQPVNTQKKKPWYNQGWVWLIVAAIGIFTLFIALSGVTEELGNVNESVQKQTDVLEDQNQILGSIKEGINQLIITIKDAVTSLVQSSE